MEANLLKDNLFFSTQKSRETINIIIRDIYGFTS